MVSTGMPPSATAERSDPRTLLARHPLDPAARAWLDEAVARVTERPAAVRTLFPAARRRCGRARLDARWTVDEAARAVLLTALPLGGQPLADELTGLHRHGDPAEQRAVLRTLPLLAADHGDAAPEPLGDLALPLVRDALRGNDSSLVEAALGPYGAARLPDAEYRQAVLKCVFHEIPLDRIDGLPARADAELARMLADFAHERVAAGRDVPADIWPVVRPFPAAARLADGLTAETRAAAPERREAAERALRALHRATASP
ncbi:EboA domain-containing protein [Streptomyces caniscabiei]|uniref:EboA domain-containing protein n=1 Tax=Streptomyces caniscabiei TaxID=2746961 RepID=A0ABU4ML64_9ACTN|nr:EboA domain-containing protein [Streptomyces caniscabiei]MBE4738469.1 EboA domain-containing protein [Streptomyces caniscabiei]MBE4756734.1 EboA domain-containing protein [Streptomyces caniscabiei]MBE4768761.1 EboA domain-containing protein [Streptomyces caniscabiei]MBE4783105.1 EboA domain-containing protein [Streptomyces caniscabiei]MBE4792409.1 EboA domain-containing protein [Streptomyces caniscabiei]